MNSYKQDVNAIKQIQKLTSLFKNNPRMTSELLVNSAFPWSYIAGGNISIFFLINFRGSFTLRNRFFLRVSSQFKYYFFETITLSVSNMINMRKSSLLSGCLMQSLKC